MPTGDPPNWRETFHPPLLSSQYQAALESVEKVFREQYTAALNKLTRDQFIKVMGEALACGDFMRHVIIEGGGDRQMMTYAPYRNQERLKARIRELEEKLLDKERDIEEASYGEDL